MDIPLPPSDGKSFYIDVNDQFLADVEFGYPPQSQLLFLNLQDEYLGLLTSECPSTECYSILSRRKYNADLSGIDVYDDEGDLIKIQDKIHYPYAQDST